MTSQERGDQLLQRWRLAHIEKPAEAETVVSDLLIDLEVAQPDLAARIMIERLRVAGFSILKEEGAA